LLTEKRRIIAHHHRNHWTNQQGNRDLGLNRRQIVRRSLELSLLAGTRRRVDHDRPLRSLDDLVLNQDLGDLVLNLGDQNRARRNVQSPSEANLNRRDRDHDHDHDRDRDRRNLDLRARTEAS